MPEFDLSVTVPTPEEHFFLEEQEIVNLERINELSQRHPVNLLVIAGGGHDQQGIVIRVGNDAQLRLQRGVRTIANISADGATGCLCFRLFALFAALVVGRYGLGGQAGRHLGGFFLVGGFFVVVE